VPFQAIPREQAFFDLFERAAANVAAASAELAVMVGDIPEAEAHSQAIRALEHASDDLTREVIQTLDVTFVTPYDRDDIYGLAAGLDDILDAIWAVADLIVLHRIEAPLPELRQLADVLRRAGSAVQTAVRGLRFADDVMPHVIEINRLENEGDRAYRKAIARLYSGEFKPMDVLKWKGVLGQLEEAIDNCEDIANVIETIVVKHD
jgi:predicted phosphate transport protein (TIGR00153 family)